MVIKFLILVCAMIVGDPGYYWELNKHMDYIELGCLELSVRPVNHILILLFIPLCARMCV